MYDLVSIIEAALITAADKMANNIDKLNVDEIRLLHEMYIAGTIEKLQQKLVAENNQEPAVEKETKETVSEIVTAKEEVKEESKKETEVKSENKASENEETVVNDIPDETATRVINKSEIVDFYEREVRDKIAYKEGSNTPFTGVFAAIS